MKIGIFTDTYHPQINGVATSISTLRENLEMQGHHVWIFTTTDPNAPERERGIYRVPSIPFSSAGRRLGTFVNPRLKKAIKEFGIDLIHTHTEFSLGIFGRGVARAMQIPLVHTMHTIYEDYTHYIIKSRNLAPITSAVARKMTASFCNSADKVIVPTNKTRDLLLSYGVSRGISVIPTGIKLEKFAGNRRQAEEISKIRTQFHIEKDSKVIINIGRISKEKNLHEILYAMKGYLPEHRDVKLVLVGDGPAKDELEALTGELGIQNQVIFTGEQSWDDIGIYYGLGDVFVSASQSETQGLTYIEALAAGLPILAKADPCLEDVVQDDVNGYVFHNQKHLTSLLDRILQDGGLRERLSTGAVDTARKFSAPCFAQSVALLYESVITGNKGGIADLASGNYF